MFSTDPSLNNEGGPEASYHLHFLCPSNVLLNKILSIYLTQRIRKFKHKVSKAFWFVTGVHMFWI